MKTPSNKTDLSAAFNQLRQRFAESLPRRAAAMSEAMQADDGAARLRTVIAESHKLAGACGTFGYSMLGAMARQIEQLALVVQQRSAAEQEQAIPELVNLIREFERAVMQAMQFRTADQPVERAEDQPLWPSGCPRNDTDVSGLETVFADMGQGLGASVDVEGLHGVYFFNPCSLANAEAMEPGCGALTAPR